MSRDGTGGGGGGVGGESVLSNISFVGYKTGIKFVKFALKMDIFHFGLKKCETFNSYND